MVEPMKPEQVPRNLVDHAMDAWHDRPRRAMLDDQMRHLLAAVTPQIKALTLRELAAEAELKPGSRWVHFSGMLRRRADEIEQEATDA